MLDVFCLPEKSGHSASKPEIGLSTGLGYDSDVLSLPVCPSSRIFFLSKLICLEDNLSFLRFLFPACFTQDGRCLGSVTRDQFSFLQWLVGQTPFLPPSWCEGVHKWSFSVPKTPLRSYPVVINTSESQKVFSTTAVHKIFRHFSLENDLRSYLRGILFFFNKKPVSGIHPQRVSCACGVVIENRLLWLARFYPNTSGLNQFKG